MSLGTIKFLNDLEKSEIEPKIYKNLNSSVNHAEILNVQKTTGNKLLLLLLLLLPSLIVSHGMPSKNG